MSSNKDAEQRGADSGRRLILYAYWRSAASYRARIALALKGIEFIVYPVNLANDEQLSPAYLRIHPQGKVPALADGEIVLQQSLAIIEYLDEKFPTPPLLPTNPAGKARVRSIAAAVAAELQGATNTRIRNYLEKHEGRDKMVAWYEYWAKSGCDGVESMLANAPETGEFCHRDKPTMADCFLYPQVRAFQRRGVSMDNYPTIMRIVENCGKERAFKKAAPENQPDYKADARF